MLATRMRHQIEEPINVLSELRPLRMRGYLEFVLRDARPWNRGRILERGKTRNTVTFWGRGWALEKLTPSSTAPIFSAIALGSNSGTAPAANQSALVSYMTIRTLNAGTTLTTSTNAACTWQGAVSFNSNETWTNSSQIGEFALYCGSITSGNVMFNRLTTSTYINFASTNTLAITLTITN